MYSQLTILHTHALTYSLSHSLTHSLTHLFPHSLIHTLTHSTHPLTQLTSFHSLTLQKLTHALTHSLTQSTHSLTNSTYSPQGDIWTSVYSVPGVSYCHYPLEQLPQLNSQGHVLHFKSIHLPQSSSHVTTKYVVLLALTTSLLVRKSNMATSLYTSIHPSDNAAPSPQRRSVFPPSSMSDPTLHAIGELQSIPQVQYWLR